MKRTLARLGRFLKGDAKADRLVPRGADSTAAIGFLAASMAFLAVLALALALAAGRLAAAWGGELAGTATLEILATAQDVEAQARAALNVLRTTPGVASVRVVEVDEQKALLEPWLGADVPPDALPLPLLIEVRTAPEGFNAESLELRLAAEAPAAVLDDHASWRGPLITTARRLRIFAFACIGLTALALGAVLSLAARAAIAANAGVIRTLRLVGARDSYITAAFSRRFTLTALAGAAAGTAAGAALLAALPSASEQGFFLVGIGLQGWHWALPLAIPPAAALVAWAATRLAARRSLKRWS